MTSSSDLDACGCPPADVPGDAVGASLVATLVERAEQLPDAARARVLARAEVLGEHYRSRAFRLAPPAPAPVDAWSEVLAERARRRAPRAPRARATRSFVAELRAATATARAAVQVPASAGPYHGAVVAARALEELAAISPGFVSGYVDWLEDLAGLADAIDRRAVPRR